MAYAPDDYARLAHEERVRDAEAKRVAAQAARHARRAAERAEKAERAKAEKAEAASRAAKRVENERLAAERLAALATQAAQPTDINWGLGSWVDWLPAIWGRRGGDCEGATTQAPEPTAPQGPGNLAPGAAQGAGTAAQAPQPPATWRAANVAPGGAQGGGTPAPGPQGNPPGTRGPPRKMKRGRGGRPGDAIRAARKGEDVYARGLSEARRTVATIQAAPVAPAPTRGWRTVNPALTGGAGTANPAPMGGAGTANPAPAAQVTSAEGRRMENLELPQAERPSPKKPNPYATRKTRHPRASEEPDW